MKTTQPIKMWNFSNDLPTEKCPGYHVNHGLIRNTDMRAKMSTIVLNCLKTPDCLKTVLYSSILSELNHNLNKF